MKAVLMLTQANLSGAVTHDAFQEKYEDGEKILGEAGV